VGTFSVPLQVGDLSGQHFVELSALVDTGATYTSIPENTLAQLGIEVVERRPFELADDRIAEYGIGQARIRLDGRELIVVVVFAPEDSAPLLGATALEIFGFGVDPLRQSLVPVNALLKSLFE
jgi:aspartyl protease family protein